MDDFFSSAGKLLQTGLGGYLQVQKAKTDNKVATLTAQQRLATQQFEAQTAAQTAASQAAASQNYSRTIYAVAGSLAVGGMAAVLGYVVVKVIKAVKRKG